MIELESYLDDRKGSTVNGGHVLRAVLDKVKTKVAAVRRDAQNKKRTKGAQQRDEKKL